MKKARGLAELMGYNERCRLLLRRCGVRIEQSTPLTPFRGHKGEMPEETIEPWIEMEGKSVNERSSYANTAI